MVLKEKKVYVSKDEKLRTEIIQLHYDIPVAGYGEKWKIIELVAGSNKGCGAIYGRIQYVLEDEE